MPNKEYSFWSYRRLFKFTVIFSLVCNFAKADDIERAESYIQKLSNQIIVIVESDSEVKTKQNELLALFKKNASTQTISRAALGAKWRTLNDDTRKEFTAAFINYLVQKYGRQFEEFSGAKLIIERSIDAGKRGILVQTRLLMPASSPISVKWQVWKRTETLKLIDIIIEDISMLSMEREEIKNRLVIHNGNIQLLINDLKEN